MPGFTTHHIFGEKALYKLREQPISDLISKNRLVYNLGLQGPDIFFYCIPAYLFYFKNIGATAHTTTTSKFLGALLQSRKIFKTTKEKQIAKAYISGFFGHYMLDTNCHPYVYYRSHYHGATLEYFARHVNLETDIDTYLLEKNHHIKPSKFEKHRQIKLHHTQRKVIASILYFAYKQVYPSLHVSYAVMYSATFGMQAGGRLLQDRSGKRKVIARKVESYLLGHAYLSPMIPSDRLVFYKDPLNLRHHIWKNPWNNSIKSNESFLDLFQKAQKEYLFVLLRLESLFSLSDSNHASAKHVKELLAFMGNKSYHSGLDCSIPS